MNLFFHNLSVVIFGLIISAASAAWFFGSVLGLVVGKWPAKVLCAASIILGLALLLTLVDLLR